MSKLVKSVGRAISKVVKGVVNVVKKVATAVVDGVKKIASSKIGKIILVAAAVYFGGAALAGGFSSSAAGGSFLSGMGTGVANAATSLSTAWSSALSGNLSAAGSSLSAGFGGTTTALQAANTAAAAGAAGAAVTGAEVAGTAAAGSAGAAGTAGATTGAAGAAGAAAPAAKGLIGSLSPMGQFAAISGGTQLLGGAIQGAGMQKAQDEQRTYEEQQIANQRARYEASVQDFTNQANAGAAVPGAPGQVGQAPAYDPVAEAQAIGARYRAQYEAQNPPTGLVARGMSTPQTMTNNNFPVYNPYYYRG
jgi:hypothetical protein